METIVKHGDYDSLKEKYEILQSRERYLEIISSFSLSLMHLNSIEDVVWIITREVVGRMGFEDCVVYLLDKEEGVLIQKAAHGPKNPYQLKIKNPIKIAVGEGIVGSVAKFGKAEIVSDTRNDSRYILDDEYRLSEIAVPIIFENEVIGVIDSEHSKVGFFIKEHLIILRTVAAIGASKIVHAKIHEEIKEYQFGLERLVDEKTKNLNVLINKLKRSNQDLESFAYAASHDLQEPLRTITSYLQLIERRESNLSPEVTEYFGFVINGAKRMKYLLEGLLGYSRVNDLLPDDISLLNMDDILFVIKRNLYAAINKRQGQIIIEELIEVKGNKTQLIQLFQNIISNALKFSRKGIPPIVKISSQIKGGFVEFKIADNGIGIEPEFHDRIFGLFSRLNPVDSFKGSGIGLALCKRIVEYHDGEIEVTSIVEGGTCFCIRLPR
ncbi:MAG: signal transduction histidine kinase [Granulosicoccus sp.]|jgi:signal transduction histidine kinase